MKYKWKNDLLCMTVFTTNYWLKDSVALPVYLLRLKIECLWGMRNKALTIMEVLHESTAYTCNTLLTSKRDTEEVPELSNECDQGQKKVSILRLLMSEWRCLRKIRKRSKKTGTLLNIGSVFQRLCKSVASALYTVDLILLLPYMCNDFEECQGGGKTGAD